MWVGVGVVEGDGQTEGVGALEEIVSGQNIAVKD